MRRTVLSISVTDNDRLLTVARLQDNANLFRRLAAEHSIDTGPGGSAVVPVVTGTSVSALRSPTGCGAGA